MEAVFDLERLAERPLLRAGAHHAGRDPSCIARLYADVFNLARVGKDSVRLDEINRLGNLVVAYSVRNILRTTLKVTNPHYEIPKPGNEALNAQI